MLRSAGAPHAVVGSPPPDGVDETPPPLEGPCGGGATEPLLAQGAGGVHESDVDAVDPRRLQPLAHAAVLGGTRQCILAEEGAVT